MTALGAPLLRPDRLRLGLPSKGRLQAKVADMFTAAGMRLVRSRVDREYAGALEGVDGVDLVFVQAGETPDKLLAGDIHLGVTGEDMVRENGGARADRILLLKALGFGHADLVIAVPKCWIDVADTGDLDDVAADFRDRHGRPLRIATKYRRLARSFLRARGVANYQLVDSQGATEGAVAARAAEAIIDITSTGETLRANHLKVLTDGLILKSEAHLCASLSAGWSPGSRAAAAALLARLDASGGEGLAGRLSAALDGVG